MAPPTTDGFAAHLWRGAADLHAAVLAHPFVRGLGDGSLPLARYRDYLRQDYVFLIDYARVLALGVAAAPDPADMDRLAGLLHATLHVEMDLHRRTCADMGIGPAELEAVPAAPFTFTYTRHLLAVARAGTLGEIAAALLPCQWGYAEIGRELHARGTPPVAPYREWIDAYVSEGYQNTARMVWDLCDRCGAVMGSAERARAERVFQDSCRCEYRFWDGCWEGQEE